MGQFKLCPEASGNKRPCVSTMLNYIIETLENKPIRSSQQHSEDYI